MANTYKKEPLVLLDTIRTKADSEIREKAEKKLKELMVERDAAAADLQAEEARLAYFAAFTAEQWAFYFNGNEDEVPESFFLPGANAVKTKP